MGLGLEEHVDGRSDRQRSVKIARGILSMKSKADIYPGTSMESS